jgi:hypothetical protein
MKCDHCKKKIDLGAEFTCSSCEAVVCIACRLPEVHGCTPTKQKVKLDLVVPAKIEKL